MTRRAAHYAKWLVLLSASLCPAWQARADELPAGTWEGRYFCGQGDTALRLILRPDGQPGEVGGLFRFSAAPRNPGVPEGCFTVSGTYDGPSRTVRLFAGRWLLRPSGYVTVDLTGQLAPGGDRMRGQVIGPLCRDFELQRVSAETMTVPSACLGSTVAEAP